MPEASRAATEKTVIGCGVPGPLLAGDAVDERPGCLRALLLALLLICAEHHQQSLSDHL